MILIVSGEGPTDIGTCTNGQGRCHGVDFKPGPMGMMVDKIAEDQLGYSLADAGALDHVSESSRSQLAKALKKTFVIGKRRDFETAHFFKEARALARLAMMETEADDTPRGVVLFRDADGTRSTERGLYETRVQSIYDGFAAEGFEFGVPMVPKPKSEAWLICALKEDAYQNCGALEEIVSGNDNAPEPAKEQLEARLIALQKTVADLADLVREGVVDALRVEMKDMKSFNHFEERLREVLQKLPRKPI